MQETDFEMYISPKCMENRARLGNQSVTQSEVYQASTNVRYVMVFCSNVQAVLI